MRIFLQHLVNAASLSATYSLLAIGLTAVFGLARIMNFAHAAIAVLAAFLAWELTTSNGINFWLGLMIVVVVISVLSLLMERVLFRPLLASPIDAFVLSTGVLVFLEAFMQSRWSIDGRRITPPFQGAWSLGGLHIDEQRAVNFLVAAAITIVFIWVLRATRFGRSVRATAEDPVASTLAGIDTVAAVRRMFLAGTALAAVAGVLLGTILPFSPFSSSLLIVKVSAIAIIGGLGNITGAVAGSLLLAVTETMGAAYWSPEWVQAYSLAFMIIVLLIRPTGLFHGVGPSET